MIATKAMPCGAGLRTMSPRTAEHAHASYRIGLSQLALRGLSENWLWKELWRLARQMRSHRRDRHFDFDLQSRAEDSSLRFRPCPGHDFNGAGFLCFTSFQSIVERAHWSMAAQDEVGAEPRSRDVFYYGNIDVGDSVRVVRAGRRCGPDRPGGRDIGIWDKVIREADGETIAEVFTRKILPPCAVAQ
jgi:hypothetical protein